MVTIRALYEGELHCRLTHGPSGQSIQTDAPTDNMGKGQAFSPTDLVGAALGSCILTVMGIVAARHSLDLIGTAVEVQKEMTSQPTRRIGKLLVRVTFPRSFPEETRQLLERTARSCPVHQSLDPRIESPIEFQYPA